MRLDDITALTLIILIGLIFCSLAYICMRHRLTLFKLIHRFCMKRKSRDSQETPSPKIPDPFQNKRSPTWKLGFDLLKKEMQRYKPRISNKKRSSSQLPRENVSKSKIIGQIGISTPKRISENDLVVTTERARLQLEDNSNTVENINKMREIDKNLDKLMEGDNLSIDLSKYSEKCSPIKI